MREIKNSQLQYYCTAIGEIHECGKRMLDSVDELPQSLQRPYLDYWTAEWNLYCFIAFLDGLPGILLCAEYDEDYCLKQGIPIEDDAQYAVLFHYGERLEKLAQEINPHIIVGIGYDCDSGTKIMLFIPTDHVPLRDILKLYYLMDQYGYKEAPDGVHWSVKELTAFVKRLHLAPKIEGQMLATLDTDVELGTPPSDADSKLQYMGLDISRSKLYSKDELMNLLNTCGGLDSTLDKVRDTYAERFGNQLIWKYPFSESMQGGGTIIPVQEGFLFLPYNCVFEHGGARYQLSNAELLSVESIQTLQNECRSYVGGLLTALGDMEYAM